ncbi:hypothetical protein PoB_000411600 [Plakobranchus ocellatus]|uniref:Uncharacterized protein n=1 Tax=Plakobranchus ocellatus TaxID=259542 RepID=A0AAV3Y348_9GAST|nr:hypothetical protein PoB_000411600 [Plakobranchus ocellatus]
MMMRLKTKFVKNVNIDGDHTFTIITTTTTTNNNTRRNKDLRRRSSSNKIICNNSINNNNNNNNNNGENGNKCIRLKKWCMAVQRVRRSALQKGNHQIPLGDTQTSKA